MKEVLKVKVSDDKEMSWYLRSKSGVIRGFQKGITLGGRTSGSINLVGLQNKVAKKICKIFASECGSKSGIMRGFQKGITLRGRTPGSAQKVFGRWWW